MAINQEILKRVGVAVSLILILSIYTCTVTAQHHTYKWPQFYSPETKTINDTSYKYECYDSRDSIISIDTLTNFNVVRYVSLFIHYTDYAHPYKDFDGTLKPLPGAAIIYRYDKLGMDKWLTVDYKTHKMGELKENKNIIIKTDTLPLNKIVRYYQVIPR